MAAILGEFWLEAKWKPSIYLGLGFNPLLPLSVVLLLLIFGSLQQSDTLSTFKDAHLSRLAEHFVDLV
jgi:hypothetical protein